LQLSDKHCKFPTEAITGAQYFDFAPKFSQIGGSDPEFCIFGPQFFDKKISDYMYFPTAKSVWEQFMRSCDDAIVVSTTKG